MLPPITLGTPWNNQDIKIPLARRSARQRQANPTNEVDVAWQALQHGTCVQVRDKETSRWCEAKVLKKIQPSNEWNDRRRDAVKCCGWTKDVYWTQIFEKEDHDNTWRLKKGRKKAVKRSHTGQTKKKRPTKKKKEIQLPLLPPLPKKQPNQQKNKTPPTTSTTNTTAGTDDDGCVECSTDPPATINTVKSKREQAHDQGKKVNIRRCVCGCKRDCSKNGHRVPKDKAGWHVLKCFKKYRSLTFSQFEQLKGRKSMRIHASHYKLEKDGGGRYLSTGNKWLLRPGTKPMSMKRAKKHEEEMANGYVSPRTRRLKKIVDDGLRCIQHNDEEGAMDVLKRLVPTVVKLVEEEAKRKEEATSPNAINRMKKQIKKQEKKINKLTKELERATNKHNPLRSSMLGGRLEKTVTQLTGFGSLTAFNAFVDCLKADGMLENIHLYRGDTTGTGTKSVRWNARALNATESIFFTLVVLRTGIDVNVVSTLFGISDTTGSRYLTTYVSFLCRWLESEFPYPSELQIAAALPAAIKEKWPTANLEMIFDAMEQRCQMASSLKVYRTLFSHYKHFPTCKFLGGIAYNGAFTFCPPTAFPGSGGDVKVTRASNLLSLLNKWSLSLADKGFMLQEDFAKNNLFLRVPPKKRRGDPQFSQEEMMETHVVGNARIYIEEAFERVRKWKIMRKEIRLTQLDMIGQIFQVCCLMTNYQLPLKRHDDVPEGHCCAWLLWDHDVALD